MKRACTATHLLAFNECHPRRGGRAPSCRAPHGEAPRSSLSTRPAACVCAGRGALRGHCAVHGPYPLSGPSHLSERKIRDDKKYSFALLERYRRTPPPHHTIEACITIHTASCTSFKARRSSTLILYTRRYNEPRPRPTPTLCWTARPPAPRVPRLGTRPNNAYLLSASSAISLSMTRWTATIASITSGVAMAAKPSRAGSLLCRPASGKARCMAAPLSYSSSALRSGQVGGEGEGRRARQGGPVQRCTRLVSGPAQAAQARMSTHARSHEHATATAPPPPPSNGHLQARPSCSKKSDGLGSLGFGLLSASSSRARLRAAALSLYVSLYCSRNARIEQAPAHL